LIFRSAADRSTNVVQYPGVDHTVGPRFRFAFE